MALKSVCPRCNRMATIIKKGTRKNVKRLLCKHCGKFFYGKLNDSETEIIISWASLKDVPVIVENDSVEQSSSDDDETVATTDNAVENTIENTTTQFENNIKRTIIKVNDSIIKTINGELDSDTALVLVKDYFTASITKDNVEIQETDNERIINIKITVGTKG